MASRSGGIAGRIKITAETLSSDNQALLEDIVKAVNVLKGVAVDLERDNQSDMVKQLESAVVGLLETYEDCSFFSAAVESVGNAYTPGPELTDFKKLLETEVSNLKTNSSSVIQNHTLMRQFKQAVWNVHHLGQPMPGEDGEDIVMTSTQGNILNIKCPLTGKPVTELQNPVRSLDCKHVYEKDAIMTYIKSKKECPVSACPKMLSSARVVCDPLLMIEIMEMRSQIRETAATDVVEDFTDVLDEDEGYGSSCVDDL